MSCGLTCTEKLVWNFLPLQPVLAYWAAANLAYCNSSDPAELKLVVSADNFSSLMRYWSGLLRASGVSSKSFNIERQTLPSSEWRNGKKELSSKGGDSLC